MAEEREKPKTIRTIEVAVDQDATIKLLGVRETVAQRVMQRILRALTENEVQQVLGGLCANAGLLTIPKDTVIKDEVTPTQKPPVKIEGIKPIVSPEKTPCTSVRSKLDSFGRIKLREPKNGKSLSAFTRDDQVYTQCSRTKDGKLMTIMTKYPLQIEGWTLTDESRNRRTLYKRWEVGLRSALTTDEEERRQELADLPRQRPPLNSEVEIITISDIAMVIQPTEYSDEVKALKKGRKETVGIASRENYDAKILERLQQAIDVHKKENPPPRR